MGILGIIGMIVVGFLVGVLARYFYPGVVALSFWMTVALGIGGSLIGGIMGSVLWKAPDGRFHRAGIVMSIICSMVLIWAYLHLFA